MSNFGTKYKLLILLLITIDASYLKAQTLIAHAGAQLGPNGGTTSAINCSGANFVAVEVHYYTGSSGVPSVSDSSGNSYTALTNRGTSSVAIRMFYTQNATTSSSFTVTVSGTSIFASATVVCFSGMATSGVFQSGTDQGNTSSAGPLTLQPSASINYGANSVIITGLTVGGATTATVTGPPTYTITDQPQYSGNNFEGGALAYSIQTSSGSTQPTWGAFSASSNVAVNVAAFAAGGGTSGQWTTGTGGAVYYTGGSVGIGTTGPTGLLQVGSSSANTYDSDTAIMPGDLRVAGYSPTVPIAFIQARDNSGTNTLGMRLRTQNAGALVDAVSIVGNGSLGVGTTAPVSQLHVRGSDWNGLTLTSATNSNKTGTLKYDPVGTYVTGKSFLILSDETANTDGSDGGIMFRTNSGSTPATVSPALVVRETGNVGIGTTNPVHPLQVAGAIGAEEVIVSATGADYVFDPGYRLAPLSEVAAYIDEHHHLPDIPSASEMHQNGAGVGEMQSKLLAKIEELTLHMIQAEERNNRLEQQNHDLQERITRLESQGSQTATH